MTIVNSTLSSESAGAKDVAPDDPLLDIEMVFWTHLRHDRSDGPAPFLHGLSDG